MKYPKYPVQFGSRNEKSEFIISKLGNQSDSNQDSVVLTGRKKVKIEGLENWGQCSQTTVCEARILYGH